MLRVLRLLRLFGGGLSQRLREAVLRLDPHIGTIEIEVNVRRRCDGHPATEHLANVAFGLVRSLPPIGVATEWSSWIVRLSMRAAAGAIHLTLSQLFGTTPENPAIKPAARVSPHLAEFYRRRAASWQPDLAVHW